MRKKVFIGGAWTYANNSLHLGHISALKLRSAIKEIHQLARFSNKYYDEKQPWIQIKQDVRAFHNTTATYIALIVNIANLYKPFIPGSSKKVYEFFGISELN